MKKLALIPLLALAIAACQEDVTQPGDGPAVPGDQIGTTGGDAELMLLGTTRGSRATSPVTLSTLVEIDPATGATVRTIGPVGYAVNGLEQDPTTGKLYASTAVWDPNHHGLIEIDPTTGAGTPAGAQSWGLTGLYTVVNNITVNSQGQMFGWWEGPDDLVSIDKASGVATEVGESGITLTFANGLAFDDSDVLYMVNGEGPVYTVDPLTGVASFTANIGTYAHHGDFDPASNLYYGISPYPGSGAQELVIADLSTPEVVNSSSDLNHDIHTVAFYQPGIAPTALDVALDIKPGSCRNPVNVKARGVLPVAILDSDELDVTHIDPASVRLDGVSPLRWSLEDVATPPDATPQAAHNCTEAGPDGWPDLTLKFEVQEIVAALGEVEDGDILPLTLTGNLAEEHGGSPIQGQDVVQILKKGKGGKGGKG